MKKFDVEVRLHSDTLESVLSEMNEAMNKIKECYFKLEEMGVLHFIEKKETTSGN